MTSVHADLHYRFDATIVRRLCMRDRAPVDSGDYKVFLTTGATLTLGMAYRDDVIARRKTG